MRAALVPLMLRPDALLGAMSSSFDGTDELLIRLIALFSASFAVHWTAAARAGSLRGSLMFTMAQGFLCCYMAFVFFPFDCRGIPYHGQKLFYYIWFTWLVGVALVVWVVVADARWIRADLQNTGLGYCLIE